jgi:hypothetical protein
MLFLVDKTARFMRTGFTWPSVECRETSAHFGPYLDTSTVKASETAD